METAPSTADDPEGIEITAAACVDAIVLVRGIPGLEGAVPTATVTHQRGIARAEDSFWKLTLFGRTSKLHFRDAEGLPLLFSTQQKTTEIRNWKSEAAPFAEAEPGRHDFGFAASVEVLWAGDLNRDRKLDLLLKQGDAEMGTSVELYLSSGDESAPALADRFLYGAC